MVRDRTLDEYCIAPGLIVLAIRGSNDCQRLCTHKHTHTHIHTHTHTMPGSYTMLGSHMVAIT